MYIYSKYIYIYILHIYFIHILYYIYIIYIINHSEIGVIFNQSLHSYPMFFTARMSPATAPPKRLKPRAMQMEVNQLGPKPGIIPYVNLLRYIYI